jgi:hypothetical protein
MGHRAATAFPNWQAGVAYGPERVFGASPPRWATIAYSGGYSDRHRYYLL